MLFALFAKGTVGFRVFQGSCRPAESVTVFGGVLIFARRGEKMRKTDYTPAYGMQGLRERKIFLAQKEKLSTYRDTINELLPFVLIRCTKYTNSKRIAEIITIYAFICAYRLTEVLDGANEIFVLIDIMVGVVGEDLGRRTGISVNDQLLFEEQGALNVAKTITEFDTYECLCLVLYYIENLDLDQIAEITDKAIDRTALVISKGQRLFIEKLAEAGPERVISLIDEIERSMDSVADSIDRNQFGQVTDCVMDYLIKNNRQQLPLRNAFIISGRFLRI